MKSDIARLCLGSAPYTLQHEPQKIIDCAREAGILWCDSASTYPTWNMSGFNVVTKVRACDLREMDWACEFDRSKIVLAHEPQAEHLVQAFKAAGYKGKIGSSIYWPETPPRWAEAIQYPLNLADRRYPKQGKLTFARSVFLQGKLLQMGYSVSDCLGYVLRQPIDYAVVGVNSVKEMEEIIRVAEALPEHISEIPAPKLTDQELDPRTWSQD